MVARILVMGLAVAVVLSFGCGKKQQAPLPQGQPTANEKMETSAASTTKTVEAVKEDAKAATEGVAKQAETVKADATAAAEKAQGEVKSAQATVDALVAEAKTLIDGKKYQDALTKLQAGLATPNLTAEQKSALQKLIDQVKAALAGNVQQDAQKAAGDLLKGLGGKK